MPCYSEKNVNTQRGTGVFDKSILGLLKLNQLGYGPFPKPETRNPKPETRDPAGYRGFRVQKTEGRRLCMDSFTRCVCSNLRRRVESMRESQDDHAWARA